MILKRLHLGNYAIFQDKLFEFPSNKFNIIFGLNEAGKTTILNFIRDSFFGFKSRSSSYQIYGGEMISDVILITKDGKEINYRRSKSKNNTFSGTITDTVSKKINEDDLLDFYGNINYEIYENVFGFSLSELARGEDSLKNQKITEVLYGSNIGGITNINDIKSKMTKEEVDLFKPGGRNPKLNTLSNLIKEKENEKREKTIVPSKYRSMLKELENKNETVKESENNLINKKKRIVHIDNLLEVREPFFEFTNDKYNLENISIPSDLPKNMKNTYNENIKDINRFENEVKRLEDNIHMLEDEKNLILINAKLLDEKSEIEVLFSENKRIESCHKDIPKLDNESKKLLNDLTNTLKRLDYTWNINFLESFNITISTRDKLQKLIKSYKEIEKNLDKLSNSMSALETEISNINEALGNKEEEIDISQYEELLNKYDKYVSNNLEYHRLCKHKRDLEKDENRIWNKLMPLIDKKQNDIIYVPLESTIIKYEKKLDKKYNNIEKLKQGLESKNTDLSEENEELLNLYNSKMPFDKNYLLNTRANRDKGWMLIKEKYYLKNDNISENDIKEWLGTEQDNIIIAYELRVKESDQISDLLFENSADVSKKEELKKRIKKLTESIIELTKNKEILEKEESDIESEWHREWENCGFKPLTPTEMKEWANNYHEYVSIVQNKTQDEKDIIENQKNIIAFLDDTKQLFPECTENNIESIIGNIKNIIKESIASQTLKKQMKSELKRHNNDINNKKEEFAKLEKAKDEWSIEWVELMKSIHFHEDWDIDIVKETIIKLDELKLGLDKYHDNHERIDAMNKAVTNYLKKVEDLVRRLEWEEIDMDHPEKTIYNLYNILSVENEKYQKKNELLGKIIDRSEDLERNKYELQKCRTAIEALFHETGTKNDEEFLYLIDRIEERDRLNAQIGKNREHLNRTSNREKTTIDNLLYELENCDFSALEVEKENLDIEIDHLEKHCKQLFEEHINLERDFDEQFTNSEKAVELSTEVEFLLAEFEKYFDRYVSLIIARKILEEAINRFEDEHQSKLLKIINDIFTKITNGKYTQVKTSSDNKFIVIDNRGNEKTPEKLSMGTREQLFLSIRLGFIEYYGEKVDIMPIIMDDILVNFDDDRAKNTAKALLEISKDKQIIFMTCHQSTVDLFMNIDKQIEPITLCQ